MRSEQTRETVHDSGVCSMNSVYF